jgi:(1->4)-alpha-D-glucan 1-alpha-D-glucosylmutase
MVPRATYRLQFRRSFGFDQAAGLAPYLSSLGISHVYASPYLRARPDSAHGYDITDHNSLNPDLGDAAAFSRMIGAFTANGLKQILDYVPNHMGVGGADNPFWLDVLEWGQDSAYAGWFDIDWESHSEYLRGKLLVPFLAAQYGEVLTAGQLTLKFDSETGAFAIWAYDTHKLPISPFSYSAILEAKNPELEMLRDEFTAMKKQSPQVPRRVAELKLQLAQLFRERDDVRASLEASVQRFHGIEGQSKTWELLDDLIRKQYWRPTFFRVAADDINYRRFFNISELAGIHMELPEVFDHTHRFVLGLIRQGIIDGLRIDHIDGLLDPKTYLSRLRDSGGASLYLVVEKILARHEVLRPDWPVDGTTGYEFACQLLQLLIDPAAESSFRDFYRSFTGETELLFQIVHEAKTRIMENEMASELLALARNAARIARQNPSTADFTQNLFYRALKEIIACFPVYRTYVDGSEATEVDRRFIRWAIAQAAKNEPELDKSVFDFLEKLLTGDLIRTSHSGYSHHAVFELAMRVQQYSGPVMAKGFEDTALFRYNRFVALNEVGGSPDQFGISVAAFHKENVHRAQHWPRMLLTTSTHDTKHGEDARSRLAALSLVPEEWASRVTAWGKILRARRGDVEATGPPSRNDEYLFFQNLVATWPAELTSRTSFTHEELSHYLERLNNATVKSLREARVNSNWTEPNVAYENAVTEYISDALNLERSEAFLNDFLPFQHKVAKLGVHNSLVQVVLKITSPGVPDFYQGSELWNLSLLDPDNRSPVDYRVRARLLDGVKTAPTNQRLEQVRDMWTNWQDGSIKLFIVSTLLAYRKSQAELFESGSYEPLSVTGPANDRVCAFRRQLGTAAVIVVVSKDARLAPSAFQDTKVVLNEHHGDSRWTEILTGRVIESNNGELGLQESFIGLPAALLSLRDR